MARRIYFVNIVNNEMVKFKIDNNMTHLALDISSKNAELCINMDKDQVEHLIDVLKDYSEDLEKDEI